MKTPNHSSLSKLIPRGWQPRLFALVLAGLTYIPIGFITPSASAGPVVIDGTDANDGGHGTVIAGVNQNGWLYMQRVLESLAPQVGNGNKIVVDLGTVAGSQARNAINSAFSLSTLPGAGWTLVHFSTAAEITSFLGGGAVSGASLATAGIIYIPTLANTSGDLGSIAGSMAAVNAGAAAIASFVGGAGNPFAGGGLFAMGENGAGAFGWLSTLIPGISVIAGGDSSAINLTADGVAAFPGLPNSAVQAAVPWHDEFTGNLGSLQVLGTALRAGAERNVILGGGALTVISEISVTPAVATNEVGTAHTVCASAVVVTNVGNVIFTNVIVGVTVTFNVSSGPNTGVNGSSVTDSNGVACFTYIGTGGVGVDTINALFVDASGVSHNGTAIKVWVPPSNVPPVAVCANVTVSADANCQANASVDGGSYDPDTGDTITVTQTPLGPYQIGTTTVCLLVTDSHGATNGCCATVTVVDTTPPDVSCPANLTVCNDVGQCSAVVSWISTASDNCGLLSLSCSPAAGSAFPVGTTTVTCTAVDTSSNSASCTFTVTVKDCEAPLVACRAAVNPAGKKIPTAGKNPKSGQNPDGFYQLLSKDNCDREPKIYIKDSASAFVAGPFNSGNIVKITQSPGHAAQKPMAGVVIAHVQLKGDPMLCAVDASGNASVPVISCKVPPPPK